MAVEREVALPTSVFETMSVLGKVRFTGGGGTQGIYIPDETILRKLLDSKSVNFEDFNVILSPK